MKFLDKILGRSSQPPVAQDESDEPLVIVPVPSLVSLLVALEKSKGAALTEDEVIAARDGAACIVMKISHRDELAQSRGYDDIDPEQAWEHWQAVRASIMEGDE